MKLLPLILCALIALPASVVQSEEDLILNSAEQASALLADPQDLLGGIISPLSGQVVVKCTDLVARGAQDIVVTRHYVAPDMPRSFHQVESMDRERLYEHLLQNYVGWQFLPHLRMQVTKHDMHEFRFANRDGVMIDYRLSFPDGFLTFIVSLDGVLTNAKGEEPSGKYDLRNTRIIHEDDKVTVHDPDGTVRYYEYLGRFQPHDKKHFYHLQKEILPNGKVLRYHYNEKRQPILIESMDPNESCVYASVQIERLHDGCQLYSSSSTEAKYRYDRRKILLNAKEKGKWGNRPHDILAPCPPVLVGVSSSFYEYESMNYCDRSLMVEYRGKELSFDSVNATFTGLPSEEPRYQVAALYFPWGDHFEKNCSMEYSPPILKIRKGVTTFKNNDNSTTVYHYSPDFLMTRIEYFGRDGTLKRQKVFEWTDNRRLRSVAVWEVGDVLLYKKSYEHDHFGNPSEEIITGDLAGDGITDSERVSRSFSYDGRNLLLSEENESGKIVIYEYLPSTNLVTQKLTLIGDDIVTREFFEYDNCYNLIRKVIDDGKEPERTSLAGVSERRITEYALRQEAPFLHMPEWIEEKYLEKASEKLLSRKHLHYDVYGNVSQEDVYGSDGVFAYTIYREYNERGDLLKETNPLGQTASYSYDEIGRCVASVNFGGKVEKKMSHDRRNNLIELKEIGADGVVHTTEYEYDLNNDLIKKTDTFNNATHYLYDSIARQPIRTTYPLTRSLNGEIVDVPTVCTYDVLGRLMTSTNGNGQTTSYKYTAAGSVKEITHPSGQQEQFRYLNGNLVVHVDQEGHRILYTYDGLGRVLTKRYRSAAGKWMGEETFSYNGFHLLKETDREGNATRYFYDGAGRKIRMEKSGRVAEYFYDALGRESALSKHNGENTLWTRYKRDLLDRVLEEVETDGKGAVLSKISYRYDESGNRTEVIRDLNGIKSADRFLYDSFHRLTVHQDPLGHLTTTTYNERAVNSWDQNVLQMTTVNSKGVATVETFDARSNLSKKEVLNPCKKTIALVEMDYDSCGNLLTKQESIYRGETVIGKQATKYSYTPENRLESVMWDFGSKDVRIASYLYNAKGKLSEQVRPDGSTLSYTYNPLGYLQTLRSSDGKIQYTLTYNRIGHLIKAVDEAQKLSVQRELDPFGNVLREKCPKNVVIGKTYDNLDRPLSLEISDEGAVHYQYNPLFLNRIARISPSGETVYVHNYETYDQNGNLLAERGINGTKIEHHVDLNRRRAAVSHPCFSQECSYDAADCLVYELINRKPSDYIYDALSFLNFEKGPGYQAGYRSDSLGNCYEFNGRAATLNKLNELKTIDGISCTYDLNGNQISKTDEKGSFSFTYDPLDRLTEIVGDKQKIHYRYDPLGRKINKTRYAKNREGWKEETTEYYLHDGETEIGAFDKQGKMMNLRVIGNKNPVAIEIEGTPYAPILDCQGNVRRLMDLQGNVVKSYSYTTFGEIQAEEDQGPFNPWRYRGLRLHPELNLIDVGERFYDPEIRRMLRPFARTYNVATCAREFRGREG